MSQYVPTAVNQQTAKYKIYAMDRTQNTTVVTTKDK